MISGERRDPDSTIEHRRRASFRINQRENATPKAPYEATTKLKSDEIRPVEHPGCMRRRGHNKKTDIQVV